MKLYPVLVMVAVLLIAADDKGNAKADRDKLQGTWRLVSLVVNGEKATKGEIKKEQTMVVEGDKFSSVSGLRKLFGHLLPTPAAAT